ncbi:MAG: hypothetical protein ACI8Y4_001315 [Candidatus Poriferisodalaceae bacterium]
MANRRVERKLRKLSQRLKAVREELAVIGEQAQHMTDDAESSRLQAMVSDDGNVAREHRASSRHAEKLAARQATLRDELGELELKQDELLDQMSSGA